MRTLLILLGLIISVASTTLLGLMFVLILTDWPLLYLEKILFLINITAMAAFVTILITIPHGRIGEFNREPSNK